MEPFNKFYLDLNFNSFGELSKATNFNYKNKGRSGAILVGTEGKDLIPLVRTTASYDTPAQHFKPIHYEIIEKIKEKFNVEFNNAHIEIYNSFYKTMKPHSDQSLDLKENSYICVFSCYDRPTDLRKLIIKNKKTKEISSITLEHNSCVLFSFQTNSEYTHQIVLEENTNNNLWLGVTFNMSKNFIKFVDNIPYLNDNILRLGTQNEKMSFYRMKGIENKEIGYDYPSIDFTVSKGDIMV